MTQKVILVEMMARFKECQKLQLTRLMVIEQVFLKWANKWQIEFDAYNARQPF